MCTSTPDINIPKIPLVDNDPLNDPILRDRETVAFKIAAMRGYKAAFGNARGTESQTPANEKQPAAKAPATVPTSYVGQLLYNFANGVTGGKAFPDPVDGVIIRPPPPPPKPPSSTPGGNSNTREGGSGGVQLR